MSQRVVNKTKKLICLHYEQILKLCFNNMYYTIIFSLRIESNISYFCKNYPFFLIIIYYYVTRIH